MIGKRLLFPSRAVPAWLSIAVPCLVLLFALMACERKEATPPPSAVSAPDSAAPASTAPAVESTPGVQMSRAGESEQETPVILMLGDSLTAGFGLPQELSFPSLIQERLWAEGYAYRVVNAGVSGDTSAGGQARLDWLLKGRVDIMVVALGANDGLRGQDPNAIRDNLVAIIDTARTRKIRVVLAGMRMPSNYGSDYARRFAAVYPEVAQAYDLPFIPFLLEGVALRSTLNQADGIHPNAEGSRIVADNVWQGLAPLLER